MHQTTLNRAIKWSIAVMVVVAVIAVAMHLYRSQQQQQTSQATNTADEPTVVREVDPNTVEGIKDAPNLVLELFNPSDQSLDKQLNETTIRQNIEQIISTSFVLGNCGLMSSDDRSASFKAAAIYALKTGYAKDGTDAIGKIQRVSKAASAMYLIVYRKTDCKDPKLPTIAKQMREWQAHYLGEQ